MYEHPVSVGSSAQRRKAGTGSPSLGSGVIAVGWRLPRMDPPSGPSVVRAANAGRTRKDVSTAETITWINEGLERPVEGGK
jgi:hypothetical protein